MSKGSCSAITGIKLAIIQHPLLRGGSATHHSRNSGE